MKRRISNVILADQSVFKKEVQLLSRIDLIVVIIIIIISHAGHTPLFNHSDDTTSIFSFNFVLSPSPSHQWC